MAVIVKGSHKGKEVRIRQFCNDWFHVDHPEIPAQQSILSPHRLEFSDEEKARIDAHKNPGVLFELYEWSGNRLKRRKNG